MEPSSAEDVNPLSENITETISTIEADKSYQSSSSGNEKIEETHVETKENTTQIITNDELLENNPFESTDSSSFKEINDTTETNLEASSTNCQDTRILPGNYEMDHASVNKYEEPIDNDVIREELKTYSKDITESTQMISEQYEYISTTEQIEQIPEGEPEIQSTEYTSEYMLEHHTENVYMPEQGQEQEQVHLVPSEQVYSSEMISDSQENCTYGQEQENQNQTPVEEPTEANENNFVSEYESEQCEGNEDFSSQEETNKSNNNCQDVNRHDTIKLEYTNPATESVTDSEVVTNIKNAANKLSNENVDKNVDDLSDVTTHLTVEDAISKKGSHNNEFVYNIKLENNTTEVHENNSAATETVNTPIEEAQIGMSNTEIIDSGEIANVSTPSSDNMAAESYTISEGLEVTEIQEGEYTIVEGPSSLEISANHPSEESNSDGTLVLLQDYEHLEENSIIPLTDEQHEMYLSELRTQSESRQSTSSHSSENRPRRGRKPTYDIPMHVLGHDISKPVESVPNGRALPKPRLGVKVPYRNLTSQIVSKAEIEKEVMERARLKQEQASCRGDVLFARKLTQRLARKIAPSPDPPKRGTDNVKTHKELEIPNQTKASEVKTMGNKVTEASQTESQTQDNSKIHNDSDLLAILEGEGEEMPILPKEVPQPQIDESNLKMLEREIALQQLQELPHQTPKQRIYRGRQVKSDTKAPVLTAEVLTISKNTSGEKSTPVTKETTTPLLVSQNSTIKQKTDQPLSTLSNKENATTKQPISKEASSISVKKDQNNANLLSPKKQPIEIEPQVKVNMVLKTYSRKRKTVELPEELADSPVPKKTMLDENEIKAEKADNVSADVYITKSSRIIKKKVIWDPDEIPSRSPKSTAKSEVHPTKIASIKVIKPVDKNSNSEKNIERKTSTDKLIKEKPTEKKSNEKLIVKKNSNEKAPVLEKKTVVARTDSPKNKTPIKNKKSRSEVDKLLMDEGAVKMLYELKNTDETMIKKKKDVYSVEKAHKEIIKKANEIKSDLEQNTSNESPKSLRKKETLTPSPIKPAQITGTIERKMSKDSTRSSLHTPPGSPAYSFPHSQSSMLVRRRSSSSISSSDEINGADGSKVSRKKSVNSLSDIPKPKRTKKTDQSKELVQPEITSKEPLLKTVKSAENNLSRYNSFTVKKSNKHVNIDMNYINEKCCCTVQVLEELTSALWKYSKEKDCNVVSITSSSKAFCLGLDYIPLISEEEDVRRKNATELAQHVRDFLLCLLKFPKVLVAGIQGDCVGLGVTMLPLFDMVIASDRATFSTPYASLGCTAEAGFLLSSPNLTNHGLAAELLYTTQKLTADDAFRRGLISRLCWPEKYNETLKNMLTLVSKGSKQSLEGTKKQLRSHVVQIIEAAINSETEILIENWISTECQKRFAKIDEKGN